MNSKLCTYMWNTMYSEQQKYCEDIAIIFNCIQFIHYKHKESCLTYFSHKFLICTLDILVFGIDKKKYVWINSYLRSLSNRYAITTINNSFLGLSLKSCFALRFW